MNHGSYLDRRAEIATYFDRTAAAAWARLTSDAPVGRIRATVEIAWAMAWKPHASQQQPLKPGSAKARLADALRVVEQKD